MTIHLGAKQKISKNVKKWLTERSSDDRINLALIEVRNTERYRSGHNEAVLKTVCPQGHMGSNPILSAH